uniref:RING-type domain-containing protein n=1 Tax=Gasterosteus aculeatus aculeatus TaxID=481459 RepID=G3N8V3_GASAC
MAEKIVLFESYLSCHVCSETFRDPVSLSCGHSFCSSCLQRFWEQAGNKNCPICKRKSSKDNIWVNFALKELADSFAERQKTGSTETEKGETKVEVVCCEHGEETKVFCEDEQKAVCPVCEFSLHQSHKVVPLEQAEEEQKGKTISREMKMIEEQISSLSDSISAVEEDLQKDQVSFLSSYKATSDQSQS